MSRFTSLQTLTLRDHSSPSSSTLSGLSICSLVPALASISLRQITIYLNVSPTPDIGISDISGRHEWELMDSALSGPALPALKRVDILLRVNRIIYWMLDDDRREEAEDSSCAAPHSLPSWKDTVALMEGCLPRLTASRRLRFQSISSVFPSLVLVTIFIDHPLSCSRRRWFGGEDY